MDVRAKGTTGELPKLHLHERRHQDAQQADTVAAPPAPASPAAGDQLSLDGDPQGHVDFPELGAYVPADDAGPEPIQAGIQYTTQHGHPIGRLAHQLGTNVETLMQLNGWQHGEHIAAGTSVKVPNTDATYARTEQYRVMYGSDKVNIQYIEVPVPPPGQAPQHGAPPADHRGHAHPQGAINHPAPPANQPGQPGNQPGAPANHPGQPGQAGQMAKVGDPASYFFTQFRSKWNPDGPANSHSCGPTSLAMALKAFGLAGNDVQKTITDARVAMTGQDNKEQDTGIGEWMKAATSYHLNPQRVQSLADINQALSQGKLVQAQVNPIVYNQGLPTNNHNYACGGQYDGKHSVLITGEQGNDYIVNDPLSRTGPMLIPKAMIEQALQKGGNVGGIALSPPNS